MWTLCSQNGRLCLLGFITCPLQMFDDRNNMIALNFDDSIFNCAA